MPLSLFIFFFFAVAHFLIFKKSIPTLDERQLPELKNMDRERHRSYPVGSTGPKLSLLIRQTTPPALGNTTKLYVILKCILLDYVNFNDAGNGAADIFSPSFLILVSIPLAPPPPLTPSPRKLVLTTKPKASAL